MAYKDKMPLKAFWEAVEERLAACSTDELRAILRAMAERTLPMGRQAFLNQLKAVDPKAAAGQQALAEEGLLADISDLKREIEEKSTHADEWEENRSWDDHGYNDEDGLGPYEDFVEPLSGLFDRTEATFDYGNLALARAACQKLFELLELEDDYGRGIRSDDLQDVNMDEARARYLRAVYETEPPARRAKVLFEEMQKAGRLTGHLRPKLNDVIQISTKPLPDQERFLPDWIAFLRKEDGANADAWLREAIRLAQGTRGLEELARTEGKKRPRAYLDWVAALTQEGKHREALAAAQEALRTLDRELPIRAAIADQLCAAAERLNETKTIADGRWEAFDANPVLERLLDLWESAPAGEKRVGLMQKAAQHVKDHMTAESRHQGMQEQALDEDDDAIRGWVSKSTLAHAYLLAGDWQAAHQLVAREKVLGWSSSDNPQGLVVSVFLVRLSRKAPNALPPNLREEWGWALKRGLAFTDWEREEKADERALQRLESAYAERLSQMPLSTEHEKEILSWCFDIAKRRTKEIVSNQHRGSYGKAAVLTAACAETLRLRGDDKDADALLNDVRTRFPRHSAFQAELRKATGQR